jgi:cytochrome c-type biogenesis protein CcmH
MRSTLAALTAGWLALGPSFAAGTQCALEGELNDRYQALTREVRCPKCQNESIADSKAPVAEDLRRALCDLVAGGASDAEAREWVRARYGDFALYRVRSWIIWSSPFVLIAIGGVVFARVVRDRARQPIDEDDDA